MEAIATKRRRVTFVVVAGETTQYTQRDMTIQ